MYTSIWKKYLPVIKIILKRAVTSEQILKLDATDFERSGASRKATTKFSIQSTNGKFLNAIKFPVSAKDLIAVFQQDEQIAELLTQNDFILTLSSKYELGVKMVPIAVAELEPELQEEESA